MATLIAQAPSIDGISLAGVAANSGGDEVANPKGNVMLLVRNDDGSTSSNVTITAVRTSRPASPPFPPMTLNNKVVAVGAGATKLIGPIPSAFNHATTGRVAISYSSVANVSIAAIQP